MVSNTVAETLTLDMILFADAAGVSSYFLSLRFDTDLEDELNVLGYVELSWSNPSGTRTLFNLQEGILASQESSSGSEGQLFTFEAVTLGDGPVNTSLLWGRVVFSTNPAAVSSDGEDIFSGILHKAIFQDFDGLFDNAGNSLEDTAFFGGASVNVPEPSVVALVGLSVVAFLLASTRSGRRH